MSQHLYLAGQKVDKKEPYQTIDRSPYQAPLILGRAESSYQRHFDGATLPRSKSPMLRFKGETIKDQQWDGAVGFMTDSEPRKLGGSGQADTASAGTSRIAENGSSSSFKG